MAAWAGKASRFFRRRPPELFWLTLVAALLAAFGLYQYRAWQEDSAEGPTLPSNVELVMHDLTATRSVAGAFQWKLSARQASRAMHEDSTELAALRMVLLDRQGKEIVITADTGTVLPNGDAISARSNVVVSLANATRLRTDTLHYDAASALVTSADPVHIEAGKFKATGNGMQVELKGRHFTLKEQVRAVMQP